MAFPWQQTQEAFRFVCAQHLPDITTGRILSWEVHFFKHPPRQGMSFQPTINKSLRWFMHVLITIATGGRKWRCWSVFFNLGTCVVGPNWCTPVYYPGYKSCVQQSIAWWEFVQDMSGPQITSTHYCSWPPAIITNNAGLPDIKLPKGQTHTLTTQRTTIIKNLIACSQ